jgi:hypothetical protein
VVWIIIARSTQELQAARAGLLHAPLDVAVLLGGHREEDHPAGQMLEGARLAEPHRGAQEAGHLGVVAAGVSGPGLRIRDRMPGHHQPVQLPQQREGRAVLGAPRLGPYPGDREAGPRLEPQLPEGLLGQPRGLELLEAQLGLAPDALADADDALGVAVDGRAHRVLECLSCRRHGALTPVCGLAPSPLRGSGRPGDRVNG